MSETVVVYGASGSGSMPVEAALTLMGVAHRVVEAPTWEGDAQRDRVAGVNPMRQIPALVLPSGEVLTESAAILLWLTEHHPEAGLPRRPAIRRGPSSFAGWPSYRGRSIRCTGSATCLRGWSATTLRPRP